MTEQELQKKEDEVVARCLALLGNTDAPKRRTKRTRQIKTRACMAFLQSWVTKKNDALTINAG